MQSIYFCTCFQKYLLISSENIWPIAIELFHEWKHLLTIFLDFKFYNIFKSFSIFLEKRGVWEATPRKSHL